MVSPLSQSLTLPCGAVLANRLCKAAMSEGMADAQNRSTIRLERLYRRWAQSGAGLLFSGNIQVDANHLERPLNLVLQDDEGVVQLSRLAAAGTSSGMHFWAQLSHTGRQVDAAINAAPLAASDVEIEVLRGAGFNFARPRPMTEAEIRHAVLQFGDAAARARKAGFTGVVLHGAHGYLISQFLSPKTNLRQDAWGGPLENRARFLFEVLAAVRSAVGPDFPIGLKLNSSDFQKGGFTARECVELVGLLNGTSLDLLELSGGSLEQPKVMGLSVQEEGEDGPRQSTRDREAYFLAFAKDVADVARMPVMMVGGFRSKAVMEQAVADGEVDVVGLGRPMVAVPDAPKRLLAGEIDELPSYEKTFEVFHFMPWMNMQLERLGDGLEPDLSMTGQDAFDRFVRLEGENLGKLLAERMAPA